MMTTGHLQSHMQPTGHLDLWCKDVLAHLGSHHVWGDERGVDFHDGQLVTGSM